MLRVTASQALQAMGSGGVLIDIRAESQIASAARSPERWSSPGTFSSGGWIRQVATATRRPELDDHVIVLCDQGYQSSLAAVTLHQLGFARATDVDGGFQAWRCAAVLAGHPQALGTPVGQPQLAVARAEVADRRQRIGAAIGIVARDARDRTGVLPVALMLTALAIVCVLGPIKQ